MKGIDIDRSFAHNSNKTQFWMIKVTQSDLFLRWTVDMEIFVQHRLVFIGTFRISFEVEGEKIHEWNDWKKLTVRPFWFVLLDLVYQFACNTIVDRMQYMCVVGTMMNTISEKWRIFRIMS